MNETTVRELLRAAAPEPGPALQPAALLLTARRRRRRRALALPVAIALPVAAALVAVPVVTMPDLPVPSLPAVGQDATAPVVSRTFPAGAVGGGQTSAEDEPFELASARLPDGREIILVGYQSVDGQRCTGFVGASGLGLPSGCHPRRTPNDEQGLIAGRFSDTDAAGRPIGTVYLWGSAPPDTEFVRLAGAQGQAKEVPVTRTGRRGYDERTYFVAVLVDGAVPSAVTAHDTGGQELARR
jgi:hypothetical protein